jgi:hypothetical protein
VHAILYRTNDDALVVHEIKECLDEGERSTSVSSSGSEQKKSIKKNNNL